MVTPDDGLIHLDQQLYVKFELLSEEEAELQASQFQSGGPWTKEDILEATRLAEDLIMQDALRCQMEVARNKGDLTLMHRMQCLLPKDRKLEGENQD